MSNNLIKVAVIMSTYDGEKYLREQIDSILDQKNVDVELFIRDDGSIDSTAEIISDYAAKNNNVIFWNKDNIINLGIRDSFLTLLKEVCDKYTEINYFAFADQDDVWKIDKLSAAVGLMQEQNTNEEKLTLYYSNKTFVDSELNLIEEEHIKFYGDFYDILWQSLASGCTMVMNREMVQLAVRVFPDGIDFYHDSWVYRLAILCSATVVFDEESHILYRQHGSNQVGAKFARIVKPELFLAFLKGKGHGFQHQIAEIKRLNGDYIAAENRKYVDWVMNYHKSFSAWWNLAFCPMARKRGLALECIWLIKLILHKV